MNNALRSSLTAFSRHAHLTAAQNGHNSRAQVIDGSKERLCGAARTVYPSLLASFSTCTRFMADSSSCWRRVRDATLPASLPMSSADCCRSLRRWSRSSSAVPAPSEVRVDTFRLINCRQQGRAQENSPGQRSTKW